MSRITCLVLTGFVCCPRVVFPGEPEPPALGNRISVAWENDLYYRQDYYYSNGFLVEFFHDKLERSPLSAVLIRTGRKEVSKGGERTGSKVLLKGPGTTFYGLRLKQEIYTPKDIALDTISPGDRPYCSTLTVSQEAVALFPERQLRLESGLRLGVLGPAAQGFKTQELAHHVSNPSRPPKGWDYQLKNDLILNYRARAVQGLLRRQIFRCGIQGTGRLGTLHTDLETGFWLRLDARNGYFRRPGPSGDPGFNAILYLSASARYVLYDATLQGGVFNRSGSYRLSREEVDRWVGSMEASVTFELEEHQLVVYTQLSTPRFLRAVSHGWMGIGYRYWF